MRWLYRRPEAFSTWRPVASCPLLPAAGFLLLGACAGLAPPEVATSRAYRDLGRERLFERTVAALRASGLEVTATDPANGRMTAVGSFDGRNWAECSRPKLFVEDSEDRHHLVEVPMKDERVQLQALVGGGPEGATLTLDPVFTAMPASPMATTPTCRTTGALERQVFEAVAKA